MYQLLYWIYLFNTGVLLNHGFNEVFWQQNPDWSKNKSGKSRYIVIQLSLVLVLIYGYFLLKYNLPDHPGTPLIFGLGSFAGMIHYLLLIRNKRKLRQIFLKLWFFLIFLIISIPLYFLVEQGLILIKENETMGFLLSCIWAIIGLVIIMESYTYKNYKRAYALFTLALIFQLLLSLYPIIRTIFWKS